ncbi:MAG: 3-hydroxybutyryl-CoA dehydrogenase [Dehalococcoidales bacterium]|nr:3-hydroxybutyryl-CoA dehydrogenase [Dehalococcoidales bacterium]
MEIKRVGVVGCGTMGSGIAQVCAQAGFQVVVSEANEELLKKGLGLIDSFLAKGVQRGKVTREDKGAIMARIIGTTDLERFADCDLMIEAVVEDMDVKKKLFTELDKICRKDSILATNTSCLSVIDIANVTSKPEKVLGLHFFNPAQLMKLLEIVKTIATSIETIETGKEFGRTIGKTTIIAPDTPGFIVNRISIPFRLNCIKMLEDGYATKEDIDTGLKLGLGHPMGQLELQDLVGLDVTFAVANSIYDETKDPIYAPPVLMKKMYAAGWWGRKTGKGFYNHTDKKQ